jgi:hypothetical protein
MSGSKTANFLMSTLAASPFGVVRIVVLGPHHGATCPFLPKPESGRARDYRMISLAGRRLPGAGKR